MDYYHALINYGQRHLKQIIGEHAVFMCELVKADRAKDTKELMAVWAKVEQLNVEWASFVARNDKEFKEVTLQLVRRYSCALQDLIIDHKPPDDLDEIIRLEALFYCKLSQITPDAESMKKYWANYTYAVVCMSLRKESFADAAMRCVDTGQLLGTWLDSYLY